MNPHDPEARITKLIDGRTHLAHKAEHAVDLETGAVVAVTVAAGDAGEASRMPMRPAACGACTCEGGKIFSSAC